MKNTEPKEGWLNRHVTPLPKKPCYVKIILVNEPDTIYVCLWQPSDFEFRQQHIQATGYLGVAKTFSGIGYNAWVQNDYEFIYYQLI